MQALTERVFHLAPPGGIFNEAVVVNLFPNQSEGARKLIVHRAVSSGEVHRLRPGLFYLARPYRKSDPHPFAVASLLHYPSHVSFESALWFHGLIPEAVHEVASASPDRSRTFMTKMGVFSFLRVPARYARSGVRLVEVQPGMWSFIASPLRAIADLVYARKGITWRKDGSRFLSESMRIDLEDLGETSLDDFEEIASDLTNGRTCDYLVGLRKEILG